MWSMCYKIFIYVFTVREKKPDEEGEKQKKNGVILWARSKIKYPKSMVMRLYVYPNSNDIHLPSFSFFFEKKKNVSKPNVLHVGIRLSICILLNVGNFTEFCCYIDFAQISFRYFIFESFFLFCSFI